MQLSVNLSGLSLTYVYTLLRTLLTLTLNITIHQCSTNPNSIANHNQILMKFGVVDYVRDTIPQDNFAGSSATWVVWANM